MWTRKELKSKAKLAFKRNYWKTVLIALVFTLVCSGAGALGAASGTGRGSDHAEPEVATSAYSGMTTEELEEQLDALNQIDSSNPDDPRLDEVMNILDEISDRESMSEVEIEEQGFPIKLSAPELIAVGGVVFVLFLVVFALSLAIEALLANPVEVGTARFFTRNLNQTAEVKELAFGFDHNYRNIVRTMFWRDVYTILWGLLLIIPGIVKAYEYRMIPYLLADDPTMTKDEAFAQSKRMMTGNKWRAFVLDLSFIGWFLLSAITLGLVNIFYAAPYKKMTDAALFESLHYGQGEPQDGIALPEASPVVTPAASVPVPPFAAVDAPAPVWDDEPSDGDEPAGSVAPDDSQA